MARLADELDAMYRRRVKLPAFKRSYIQIFNAILGEYKGKEVLIADIRFVPFSLYSGGGAAATRYGTLINGKCYVSRDKFLVRQLGTSYLSTQQIKNILNGNRDDEISEGGPYFEMQSHFDEKGLSKLNAFIRTHLKNSF